MHGCTLLCTHRRVISLWMIDDCVDCDDCVYNVYTMCIQCVYNVYATYLHIRGCKQCVCMVVWLLTLNCRVISLWMIDDCDDSVYNVYITYLQHTYNILTHANALWLVLSLLSLIHRYITLRWYSCSVYVDYLLKSSCIYPWNYFLQDDLLFHFSKKSKWNHSKVVWFRFYFDFLEKWKSFSLWKIFLTVLTELIT